MNQSLHRRFAPFLLAAALLLAACAPQSSTPKEEPFSGSLTLALSNALAGYTGPGLPASWAEERAREYGRSHPGVSVTVQVMPSPNSPAGEPAPDLIFGRFAPALSPRLAALDAELKAEEYLPGALDAFRTNGRLYGIPMLVETHVLALNEAAFQAAGQPLPRESTWSVAEFEAAMTKLSAPGRFGLGFYVLPGYHELWPFFGGVITSEGTADKALEAGLARMQRWRSRGWVHPEAGKLKADATWQLFAAAPPSFAVLPVSPWAIPLLRTAPYNTKLSVVTFPDGAAAGNAYGFSIIDSKDPKRTAAVLDLARFLAARDQQVRLSRHTGLMPAVRSAGNPFEGDPAMTRAWEAAATFRPLPAGPWEQREGEIARELLQASLGGKQPAQAAAAVATILQAPADGK